MTPTRKQLGNTIREARLAKGLTLRAAAEKLTIDPGYYSKIENGQYPLGKHAAAVAKLYGLDREDLEAKASAKLPRFGAYLRARYDLSDEAVAELEQHFATVTKKAAPKRRGST
jgi:transcriptional regulator with XRE-family HTH domain